MDLKEFKQDIISGKIPRVCLFHGEEDYLKDNYLELIEKKVVAAGTEQFNKLVVNEISHIDDLVKACDTVPVFADKRIVVVRDSGLFTRGGKKPDGIDGFPSAVEGIAEHTCLVFVEKKIDGRLATTLSVKKNGVIMEFKYQRPSALVKWVMSTLKKMGREIGQKEAYTLIEYSSHGMYNLLNEMKKLVHYSEGASNRITMDDIKAVSTRSIKSRTFDLTDAIALKDCSGALKILDEMIMLKESVTGILYLIAMQAHQLISVKKLQAEGAGAQELAASLKVPAFIATKIIKQSKGFSEEELKEIIKKCHQTDYWIKSGGIAERTAAQLLISDITSQ